MKKKLFLVTIILILFAGCKINKDNAEAKFLPPVVVTEVRNSEELKANKGNEVVVYGIIVQKEFINKGGRATGNFETLIKLEDGETFHLRNKGEKTYDYKELINKKVQVNAVVFYGNIDSDNPEHQSRVGFRIDYTVITVID